MHCMPPVPCRRASVSGTLADGFSKRPPSPQALVLRMTRSSSVLLTGEAGDVASVAGGPASGSLKIVPFTQWEALRPWADQWDRLAQGVPFRSWAWQSAWWRQYGEVRPPATAEAQRTPVPQTVAQAPRGASAALWILGVFAPDAGLVGLLPLYRETTWGLGRVLRFLGSGEVCSEYLSLLCEPAWGPVVADALAIWLSQANYARGESGLRWDFLELLAVDAQDQAVARLVARLEALGHAVHCRPGPPCWRIAIASTWEDFLRPLSRNRRRKFRLLEREFVEGRVQARCVERRDEVAPGIARLIDFQRHRRRQLGQSTCFDSPRYVAFLHDAAAAMFEAGQLALLIVEKDGSPLTVELTFRGHDRLYAYQAGIDGTRLHESPGHLGNFALIRHVSAHGLGMLDFLRGDESYKRDWEAQPHPTREFRVAACRPVARLRHTLWRTGAAAKQWLRWRLGHAR